MGSIMTISCWLSIPYDRTLNNWIISDRISWKWRCWSIRRYYSWIPFSIFLDWSLSWSSFSFYFFSEGGCWYKQADRCGYFLTFSTTTSTGRRDDVGRGVQPISTESRWEKAGNCRWFFERVFPSETLQSNGEAPVSACGRAQRGSRCGRSMASGGVAHWRRSARSWRFLSVLVFLR